MEEEQNINTAPPAKPFSIWSLLKRLFFGTLISSTLLVLIALLLVFVYEDDVKNLIIKELNKHLNSEVRIDPKNIDLTIIKSFPDCALEFKELTALDSKEFKTTDTLLYAKRLALAFNIKDLFNKNYSITKIELDDARCHLKEDKKGNANYLIWKSDTTQKSSNDSLKFALQKITLNNVYLTYKSSRQKIKLTTTLKHIDFKGDFTNTNYVLQTEGKAFIDLFQVEKTKYVTDKNLKLALEINVTGNTYEIKKAETTFNATELISNGQFIINDSLELLDITFKGNNLDIASTLSLLPEKYQTQIADYKSDGEFYAKGEVHYKANKPLIVNSDFGIKQATITYKPKSTTLTNVNVLGNITVNENRSQLTLKQVSANLNSNTFSGEMELTNFKDPYLKLQVAANTKLEELVTFYPIDTLEQASGSINVKANIEGLVSDLKSNIYSPTIKASGESDITNIKLKFKQSEKELNIPEGKLSLNDRRLNVFGLKLLKGNSDIMLVGEFPNFLGYLFDNKTPLSVIANVTSNSIEVEDFLFATSQNNTTSSTVSVPDNLDFNVNITVNKLSFGKFVAEQIIGTVLLKNQKLALKDVSLQATDGIIKLNAFADASKENIVISGDCDLEKLNIQKLFTQLNNFGQSTLQDKNLKGFVTANIDFTGNWSKQLELDLNSLNATSSILIERGELIGFKPLESLGKYIDINELKHIKFSTLQSALEIKNKTITIPRTSIKSNAINIEWWGKHTFDNVVDYHIQLLLSELLAKKTRANKAFDEELSLVENDPENRRSVFILMTGPIDNPTIKYDRKGAKEKIKQDLKQEKQTIKQLLKEEFGLFKKDSIKTKETDKSNQKFKIQFGDDTKKTDKPLTPKKKEEDEDDF